jgi:hypothetical protein
MPALVILDSSCEGICLCGWQAVDMSQQNLLILSPLVSKTPTAVASAMGKILLCIQSVNGPLSAVHPSLRSSIASIVRI